MKRKLLYMVSGLFLVGVIGTAQAAGYTNEREDCCTEGPPYNRDFKQDSVTPTIVIVGQEPLYIEGMRFAPRAEGPKTVVPRVSDKRDWCCEDLDNERLIKLINKIEPAAGN